MILINNLGWFRNKTPVIEKFFFLLALLYLWSISNYARDSCNSQTQTQTDLIRFELKQTFASFSFSLFPSFSRFINNHSAPRDNKIPFRTLNVMKTNWHCKGKQRIVKYSEYSKYNLQNEVKLKINIEKNKRF